MRPGVRTWGRICGNPVIAAQYFRGFRQAEVCSIPAKHRDVSDALQTVGFGTLLVRFACVQDGFQMTIIYWPEVAVGEACPRPIDRASCVKSGDCAEVHVAIGGFKK